MDKGIVSFSNPGKIDPRVWSTFGVSVKESDGAIGQFGTGLKYAIAVLMRECRTLTINSGDDSYVFGVESADIRGKEFAQVTCNGSPLPFTTHLGAKWEVWQAYRELYSNCLDEGGSIGGEGETVILAEVGDIYHGDVFLERHGKSPISSTPLCDIYQGQSDVVYYRGIRAMELSRPSLFTYDIKQADLTEDRTIKYGFQVSKCASSAALAAECPDFVHRFLTQSKGFFEEGIDFDYCHDKPSQAVMSAVQQYRREPVYLQRGMTGKAVEHLGVDAFEPVEMDARQLQIVEKASNFCSGIGMPITFPVKLVGDMGSGVLAVADKRTREIYLSDRVLTQGVKQVASTLIEENLHLKEGLQDCTYDMQSYLFDQIVTMGERLTGDIL